MVEHAAHNRGVVGSIPTATTLPHRAGPILVALSGGSDSTALLLWLLSQGHSVQAAHFDHDLRGGSAADADAVAALCDSLGVVVRIGKRRTPLPSGSRQAGARSLRYEFLEQVRTEIGAGVIALGHTADDVVEGVLLHLLRGTGLAGLRGMPARRGPIERPFLNVWKAELVRYLEARQVAPCFDPSNLDRRSARVRVRLDLLPRLELESPGIGRAIHRISVLAAAVQARLESEASSNPSPALAQLREMAPALRVEHYRRLYLQAGGVLPALNRRHLQVIDRLAVGRRTGAALDLPRGLVFRVLPNSVGVFGAKAPRREPVPELVSRPCAGCETVGAVHLDSDRVKPQDLRIGFRSPGLSMRPNPGSGTRKLQDLLTDAKIPRHERDSLPLVFAGGRLVWVPGIAVEASLRALPGTPALHLEVRPKVARRKGVPGAQMLRSKSPILVRRPAP